MSAQRPSVEVRAAPISGLKIARPGPISLYDAPWKPCGTRICLTPREVAESQANKVEIGGWIRRANGVITYYENGVTNPDHR